MIVVSDTSPITNLIRIDQLDLLQQLFEIVIIPRKVYEELSEYETQKDEIDNRTWIFIKDVENSIEVNELEDKLDIGEAEAIVLAKELKAAFLIIDERKGRKIAEEKGLHIVGLLGVLISAKTKGYLKELKPLLDKLVYEIGFRVSEKLYKKILEEVGE